MDAVASFKHATSLVTDKKINLVYGLNGTGKSTISNFLYEPHDHAFTQCRKTPKQSALIRVYNQRFIRDNFFEADSLKGIFSLSKENTAAEQKITKAAEKQSELEQLLQSKQNAKDLTNQEFEEQERHAEEEVWDIKTTYTGGDRVLEYCLEGLKGKKETLFTHLLGIAKPTEEPDKTIQALRKEVEELKGSDAQPQQQMETLTFQVHDIESDPIFGKSILGNTDSEVATLIEQLGNSDWVKQGLAYLPDDLGETQKQCPFCQENTISAKFADSIKAYFDVSYQKQLDALDDLLKRYKAVIGALPALSNFTDHAFAKKRKSEISNKYQLLTSALKTNTREIEEKIKSPKAPVTLSNTTKVLEDFNQEILAINKSIDEYNERLKNKEITLAELKNEFWRLMRSQYDQTISRFVQDRQSANQKLKGLDTEIRNINSGLAKVKEQIKEAQKQTVNMDAAVAAINAGLLDLGIDGFSVQKHSSENLYRIVRADDTKDAFHTLSEGEKGDDQLFVFLRTVQRKVKR